MPAASLRDIGMGGEQLAADQARAIDVEMVFVAFERGWPQPARCEDLDSPDG
jgi:hypothetical protein